MIKKVIQFLLSIFIILIVIIFYLSIFGVDTQRFNKKIKTEISNVNNRINLELNTVKLLLRPLDLSINIKTFQPVVFIGKNELKLESIKTNISLRSFFNNQLSIDDLNISTKEIKLTDIILFARSFNNSTELFILKTIIKEGSLVGDIKLNFDNNGKIKDDYEVNGYINNGKLDILGQNNFDSLNLLFKIKKKEFILEDIKTKFNQIELSSDTITIKEKNNTFLINGKVTSLKKNIEINLVTKLFGDIFKNLNIKNINLSSENNFNFILDKKFKISNFNLETKVNLNQLNYKPELLDIKNYLPNFKELIKLENHKILIKYKKNKLDINGKGNIVIENKSDVINYKLIKKNTDYFFDVGLIIDENPILFNFLQYKKQKNLESTLKFNGIYRDDQKLIFNLISFKENNNKFLIKNFKLNKKLKISSLDLIDLNYINYNNHKNQITIKNIKENYQIIGNSFDANLFIDTALNSETDENFPSIFENLDSIVDIKVDKVHLDKTTFVNNLKGNISFKDNKIYKLNLDSNFSNDKKLIFKIFTNKNNETITTLFSDYPKPLVKQYKFIKGFEEGVLDFRSTKKNGVSTSVLIIDNFKVKEVPVFAKLLTLASLQGMADLLTGEGIRFTDFEMKFSNTKKLMTINEMYAIGPAVSIMMDGYVESKKLISLRGTLVPATTINRSIASIPLIGDLLVGKKVGEGVFGVSFKIKGPPKNLKTTVNPVKTLTPRFITRTLEKIKKD